MLGYLNSLCTGKISEKMFRGGNMASGKNRNEYVDIMRGVAMLLVVLGHTMTGSTVNSESSFLFNIVWSLQMPLFILISGYVTRYSRPINDGRHLFKFLKKRSVAYLLPWCVWTILVRGILFRQSSFLNPCFILWHMDNGYWFLFTIWTTTMIFGISEFIAAMLYKKDNKIAYLAIIGIVYVVGMACLAGIGMAFGLSFLCIKLTLYYMPFFFAGFLYGQLQDRIFAYRQGDKVISISVAVSLTIWLVLLTRFNLYEISDGGIGIIIRAVASLTGCIAVVGLGRCVEHEKIIGGGICWFGLHSLEIYLSHYLLLNMLKPETIPSINSILGAGSVTLNYLSTLLAVTCVVIVLNGNKHIRWFLFGKIE